MSGGRDSSSEPARRAPAALLLAVAAISLVPRLWLAAHRPLSHNGAWHLFAARFFRQELGTIAHPPLFLLLLKACDLVSRSLLSYRFVPLAAGVASVLLVGLILDRLGCVPAASALGALTIALSTTAIALSVQVEGFTLAAAFVLATFFFALDLLRMDPQPLPPLSSRAAFAVFASLALMTEYLSGLFLIALVLAPLLAALLRPDYRRRLLAAMPRRFAADALTLLPPALVGAALYRILASSWIRMLSGPASGLPRFYYFPGVESPGTFLARTFSATGNLYSPVALAPRTALAVLGLFLAVAIVAPAAERPAAGRGVERLFPALVLTLLLAIGAALGYLGRYPFGGTHRHQILILYFAVLAGAVAFDRILRSAPAPRRLALAALGATAILLSALHNRNARVFRDEPMNVRAGTFARNLGGPGIVHLDQLNFIGLFMDFYAWDCRFAGLVSESPRVERYEFSRGDRKFTAIYHRFLFLMDFRSPALYSELRSAFHAVGPECQIAFCVNRNLFTGPHTLRPQAEREDLQRKIPDLASAAGLALRAITIDDDFVEVALCPRP
jgi:hypothetical protein